MTESDQTTKDEELIDAIQEKLRSKFKLETEYIGGGKLGIEEFNGFINSDDTYYEVEGLCESLCDWIMNKFNVYCNYSLIDTGYELVIEVI